MDRRFLLRRRPNVRAFTAVLIITMVAVVGCGYSIGQSGVSKVAAMAVMAVLLVIAIPLLILLAPSGFFSDSAQRGDE